MNYYEHHLGDYAAATGHLSWDEDMAYTRLIRAYYHHEKPIPAEPREAYRLARASTPGQRKSVDTVLKEFFDLRADGWHQKRCDEEIARFRDKQSKAKRSAETRWSAQRSQSGGNANASPNAMRTHSDGNADGMLPDTRHQTPDKTASAVFAGARSDDPEPPNPEVRLRMALIRGGMDPARAPNTGDPRLLAMVEQGVTEVEAENAARDGTANGKGLGWIVAAINGRRSDAAAIRMAPPTPVQQTTVPSNDADTTRQMLDEQTRRAGPTAPDVLAKVREATQRMKAGT